MNMKGKFLFRKYLALAIVVVFVLAALVPLSSAGPEGAAKVIFEVW
jgi:hypothetical protein